MVVEIAMVVKNRIEYKIRWNTNQLKDVPFFLAEFSGIQIQLLTFLPINVRNEYSQPRIEYFLEF